MPSAATPRHLHVPSSPIEELNLRMPTISFRVQFPNIDILLRDMHRVGGVIEGGWEIPAATVAGGRRKTMEDYQKEELCGNVLTTKLKQLEFVLDTTGNTTDLCLTVGDCSVVESRSGDKLLAVGQSGLSEPWLDPIDRDRPLLLCKTQLAQRPGRNDVTYVRLLQVLVQNPLTVTVDDATILRLLAMNFNVLRHFLTADMVLTGPQVLASMRSRVSDAEDAAEDAEGEASVLSQFGLAPTYIAPTTTLFLRQLQLSRISIRANFMRRTSLAPKIFPSVPKGMNVSDLRLILPEAELQEVVGNWVTIVGRLRRIYLPPAQSQILRQILKLLASNSELAVKDMTQAVVDRVTLGLSDDSVSAELAGIVTLSDSALDRPYPIPACNTCIIIDNRDITLQVRWTTSAFCFF